MTSEITCQGNRALKGLVDLTGWREGWATINTEALLDLATRFGPTLTEAKASAYCCRELVARTKP